MAMVDADLGCCIRCQRGLLRKATPATPIFSKHDFCYRRSNDEVIGRGPNSQVLNFETIQRLGSIKRTTTMNATTTPKMTTPSSKTESPSSHSIRNGILRLAFVYYYRVFLRAFLLGMVRVLWLEPLVHSAFTAVALEVPVILFLSWYIIHKETKNTPRPLSTISNRLFIGLLAFGMLMTSEYILFSLLSTDKTTASIADFVHHCVSTPEQRLGLYGQVLYGCIPAVHAWSSESKVHPAPPTLPEGQSIKRV
jgi:hypothetical protein